MNRARIKLAFIAIFMLSQTMCRERPKYFQVRNNFAVFLLDGKGNKGNPTTAVGDRSIMRIMKSRPNPGQNTMLNVEYLAYSINVTGWIDSVHGKILDSRPVDTKKHNEGLEFRVVYELSESKHDYLKGVTDIKKIQTITMAQSTVENYEFGGKDLPANVSSDYCDTEPRLIKVKQQRKAYYYHNENLSNVFPVRPVELGLVRFTFLEMCGHGPSIDTENLLLLGQDRVALLKGFSISEVSTCADPEEELSEAPEIEARGDTAERVIIQRRAYPKCDATYEEVGVRSLEFSVIDLKQKHIRVENFKESDLPKKYKIAWDKGRQLKW